MIEKIRNWTMVIVVVVGVIYGAGMLNAEVCHNTRTISKLQKIIQEYNVISRRIDQRLSRIEGKLGVN